MLREDSYDRCLVLFFPLFLPNYSSDNVQGDIGFEVLVKDGCFKEENVAAVRKEEKKPKQNGGFSF